ncbi:hypothetical protein H2203_003816 [Taxawa tesnikishii (nom. ined.)]|nr:hypothetical protein H2203_003816 [Dothideales sp. JES 119]
MAALIKEAGFPPGVINVLSGHGAVSGAVLSSHMDVRALSFTGSGRTGRLITKAAADSNLKKVTLELGGKSPNIVFPDADLESAAEGTQYSIQWNSGQVCMANSRIYVEESAAERFVDLFKAKFGAVKAGDPTDGKVDHGPLADEAQFKTVSGYLQLGQESGAQRILGDEQGDEGSLTVAPTVFTNAPEGSRIMKEEVFGPVVVINTFRSEEEVLKKANDTEYGLYASVYTKDLDRAMRCAKALESGYVGVNCTR